MTVFRNINDAWTSLSQETQMTLCRKTFEFAWLMRDSEFRQIIHQQNQDTHFCKRCGGRVSDENGRLHQYIHTCTPPVIGGA
jgi:hypothetical protein